MFYLSMKLLSSNYYISIVNIYTQQSWRFTYSVPIILHDKTCWDNFLFFHFLCEQRSVFLWKENYLPADLPVSMLLSIDERLSVSLFPESAASVSSQLLCHARSNSTFYALQFREWSFARTVRDHKTQINAKCDDIRKYNFQIVGHKKLVYSQFQRHHV